MLSRLSIQLIKIISIDHCQGPKSQPFKICLFFLKISVSKILKESGSTWDVDVKLPKFAENADKEFEKIVAFINKVLSWKKKTIILKVLTECWVLLQPQN